MKETAVRTQADACQSDDAAGRVLPRRELLRWVWGLL